MGEIFLTLLPSILYIILLTIVADLYLLVRKYLKLKIEKLKKER